MSKKDEKRLKPNHDKKDNFNKEQVGLPAMAFLWKRFCVKSNLGLISRKFIFYIVSLLLTKRYHHRTISYVHPIFQMNVWFLLEVNPGPPFMKCSLLNAHNFQKHGWNKVLAKEDLFFACILMHTYLTFWINFGSQTIIICVVYCYLWCVVCLGFSSHLRIFHSWIWRRHYYRWRTAKFDLCSARMVIEQWEFFSVPHLLWQEAYVYNGHLHGPVTLKPDAERLAVDLSLPDFTT